MPIHDLEKSLSSRGKEQSNLHKLALMTKMQTIGNEVYTRALIEVSNICQKDCLYCGIRKSNDKIRRYRLDKKLVRDLAINAYANGHRSLVIQSGEIISNSFTNYIARILEEIKIATNNELHITLSCGEQDKNTYKIWKGCGAHRYLLRIETSNQDLYNKIHPNNSNHSFHDRVSCLHALKELGYQMGTGILVGFPGQSLQDIAKDIKFIKDLDTDMVGLGPYLEHPGTPLFNLRNQIPAIEERLNLTLNTIALLRLEMKDINIAASTACEAISINGRELAILAGANVIMPNFTPEIVKENYDLYPGKVTAGLSLNDADWVLKKNLGFMGIKIVTNQWGDSLRFKKRQSI